MPKSQSHERAQSKAAGRQGETEVKLPSGGRLDALTEGGRAIEIERSGKPQALEEAARRLQEAKASQHVLQVPQQDMERAAAAMRKVGVPGTVKNMSGTKRQSVR